MQTIFDRYPMLRLSEAPVEGIEKLRLTPMSASLCNALFAATGKRIRSLPVRKYDLSW
ncbi:MAG: hypothetical protein U9N85_07060 [Bacteroidota bacterium]|nr:hypothetical protein [Bacteroidota bacterium]